MILILNSGTNQPIAVYGRIKSKCVSISTRMYMNLAQEDTNLSYSKTKSPRNGTDEE